MIDTPGGSVPIETLRAGDLVMARDNAPQVLRWIGGTRLSALHLRPIRIRAGALGAGLPAADLLVSPQHRVLVRSAIARRMFDAPEVRVAAKHLLTLEGIDIATDQAQVAYFHLLFDRHELVISNGVETESLYAGAEALASLGRAEMEEIFALMPALRDPALRPEAARPLSGGRKGRALAARHARHQPPLVAEAGL